MKIIKIIALLIVLIAASIGYYFYSQPDIVKNTEAVTQKHETQFKHDTLPIHGTFRWTFFLGPVEQISIHTFASDHIDYKMKGKVHSTDYQMKQLSYDNHEKKWIGQTPDGTVYTLFFKNNNNNTVEIYKHKCILGLPEAIALKRPADDTTADHGWNVYTLEGVAENGDTLAFSGIFYNNKNQSFGIHDDKATWKNVSYQKLTHHLGERRWVGQHNNQYLVIFYQFEKGDKTGKFSVQLVDDVEKAYKLKHGKQTFSSYTLK